MGWVVFDGSVGGVGKSMGAAAYGEVLAAKGLPFAVVEADRNNNVADYFGAAAATIHQVDLSISAGWIELLNVLDSEKTPDVILAMPAGVDTAFENNAKLLASAVKDLNRSMSFVWSLNRSPEAVSALKRTVAAFAGSPVKFVAARNTFFGDPVKFKIWNESDTRKSFLKAGGIEIDIPELDDSVVQETFNKHPKVRFSANGTSGIKYGERQELKRWLGKMTEVYDGIAEKIAIGKP